MAKTPRYLQGVTKLFDALVRPVKKELLAQEIAGPTVGGVRSPISGHPAQGLTPQRLARILRAAENNDATAYMELAEEMEEKDLHYLSVLGTRKRQVTQLEITVEAAGDDADSQADAQLLRDWLARDCLHDDLFDIMDAVGKGYSLTELIWDTTAMPWMPTRLEWVDPRWTEFDETGRNLLLKDDTGVGQPLDKFKYVYHRVRAKSGLAIRSGLARAVAWAWMFKNYTVKDWVAFCEVYGMPLRLGRYENGASEKDKAILLQAVTQFSADAAAIVPKSMDIEFVKGEAGEGALFQASADWWDRQISKAVLGQAGTTDMQSGGGYAQSKTLDGVRGDIEADDAKGLAATLTRDIGRPIVDLNRGPPKSGKYPRFVVGRAEAWDAATMMPLVKDFVDMGGKVEMSVIRDRLGLEDPAEGAELLVPTSRAQTASGSPGDPVAAPDGAASTLKGPEALLNALKPPSDRKVSASVAPGGRDPGDAVDRLADQLEDDWVQIVDQAIRPIEDLLAGSTSLEEARDRLATAIDAMPTEQMRELLARSAFAARLAGASGLELGETSPANPN